MKGLDVFLSMALGLPLGVTIGAMMNFFLCWCFGCRMKRHMVWRRVKPWVECAAMVGLIGAAAFVAGCVVAQGVARVLPRIWS